MGISTLELIIVAVLIIILIPILLKYFKWAVEGVIVLVLVILGLYIALRVLNYADPSGALREVIENIKNELGFNDPKTQQDVIQLTDDVVETTKADEFISKFNLKEIWDDIKELLKF